MPTPLDTFASYVPAAVARHHGAGAPAPDQPSRRPLRAALLFADISGFTALTERLAQRGPAGVEELSRLLNTSFGQILDTIESHGGDVVKFAGDALLAIWPVEDVSRDHSSAPERQAENQDQAAAPSNLQSAIYNLQSAIAHPAPTPARSTRQELPAATA